MEAIPYLPAPDSIPAFWWLFELLDVLFFSLHIILVNIVVGGTLLLFLRRLSGSHELKDSAPGILTNKLPTLLALGITIGIAPLLFVQVVYGHLFYASSVVIASWWMLIIPILIIGYYMLYVQARSRSTGLASIAALLGLIGFLYIGLLWVNNMTLMVQPRNWIVYFAQRDGWLLNMSEPTLWPRYLHFIAASIAIAGLFSSIVWHFRKQAQPDIAPNRIGAGLNVFAYATIAQIIIGFWWLIALPRDLMLQFMGGNLLLTILLLLGILLAIGALVVALLKKLALTVIHVSALVLVMSIQRAMLRSEYLRGIFDQASLQIKPQYDVLLLFLVVLAAGLACVWWMVKAVRRADAKGVAV